MVIRFSERSESIAHSTIVAHEIHVFAFLWVLSAPLKQHVLQKMCSTLMCLWIKSCSYPDVKRACTLLCLRVMDDETCELIGKLKSLVASLGMLGLNDIFCVHLNVFWLSKL